MDDIGAITDRGGYVFIQAKRGLQLGSTAFSPLAEALDQAVRQYIYGAPPSPDGARRRLEADRDVLVICTDTTASAPVRTDLRAVVTRLASHPTSLPLDQLATSNAEQRALDAFLLHLRYAFARQANGTPPSEGQLRQIGRLLRVVTLDVDSGGADRVAAETYLRSVLDDSAGAPGAWNDLVTLGQALIEERRWASRDDVRRALADGGHVLGIDPLLSRDAQRLWDRLDRASTKASEPIRLADVGPAAMLRADRQVVSFVDRPELARIEQWCDAEQAVQVMVVTGAAGVGKTRLALELSRRREALHWMCRLVRPGDEMAVVSAAREVYSGPLLLIIDYAESRLSLAALLREAAESKGDRIRILLLARSLGEWWEQLAASLDASVRSLATAAHFTPVGPAVADQADIADLVQSAATAFASALGLQLPGALEVRVRPGPVSILVLHAAALLAVLKSQDRQQAGSVQVNTDDQVLDELLSREKAFWLGSARALQLTGPDGIDSVVAAQAVTVACLIAVADEDQGAQALARVPGLADASAGLRQKIARWLQQIYPPETPESDAVAPFWWGSLQPDLLAERHAIIQFAAAPNLLARCLLGLTVDQAVGALTVLNRACAHGADKPGMLAAALRADLANLAIPAVQVTVQTGGPLGRVLANVLSDADLPIDQLVKIHRAIPSPTLMLAAADAVLTGRIVAGLPEGCPPAERAQWNYLFSSRLSQVGRDNEAVLPARKAVGVYRELSAAEPGQHESDLAAALSDLSVRLLHVGRAEEASAIGAEALTIRRQLAEHEPERFPPDLAISMSNLAAALAESGKARQAIALAQEAVEINRQLAQVSATSSVMADLAASQINLAALSSRLGRTDDALSAVSEASAIYLALASANPDRFLPDLAISLTNLAVLLADAGHLADALTPSGQAVVTYRQLAEINPERYSPELATSTTNLGTLLSELGRHEEALIYCEDAVLICRNLAQLDPNGNHANMAAALSNLGICYAALGRYEEALHPTEEAAAIYSALAAEIPERYAPEFARIMANLGIRLSDLGRHADAISATRQAVASYRQLAQANPGAYRHDLASSLDDLALRFAALGQAAAALPVSADAVRIYRDLITQDRGRHLPRLAIALTNLGGILADLRRMTAALDATQEALDTYRELAQTHHGLYQAETAGALVNLSRNLLALGRQAEALAPAREAEAIYRPFGQQNPRWRHHLAISLDTLADALASTGDEYEAEIARVRAEKIRKKA